MVTTFLKKTIKDNFSTFVYFYRYLGYRLFVIVGLSIAVGFLDGMGLTMFLPLLKLAEGGDVNQDDSLGDLSFIVDAADKINLPLSFGVVLLFLMVFFALKGLVSYLSGIYKITTKQYFTRELRLKLIRLFDRYSYTRFVLSDVGHIQNAMTGEVSRATGAFTSYFSCFQNGILILVYLFFAFLVDWKFTLLISLGGLLTNFFYRIIYKKTKTESVSLSQSNSSFQGLIIQYIANYKYLRATGFSKNYSERLSDSTKEIEQKVKTIGKLDVLISASREPILVVIICLVIWFQTYYLKGSFSAILVSLLFFYRALTSLIVLQTNYNSFLAVYGSLDAVSSFEKELKNNQEKNGKELQQKAISTIEVQELSFAYNSETTVLQNVNLVFNEKQTYAVVGESGSGKTTLANIVTGLLKPTVGSLLINGVNSTLLDMMSYQRKIGYISQDPVIFSDTIFNNITLWADYTEENIQRFNEVIQQASIADFIKNLPAKEHAALGNNGVNLSGGQKQRISIARELFKKVDLLILDEATSALDSENEKIIQENIDLLHGHCIFLIIAHRLSTIKNADSIIVMSEGKVVDQGNFSELLTSSENFRKMVQMQGMV
ncbi:ABC transporter ATP-binding protein [Flavobacterium sp.]|uniref:ABC transporter ATP-binding protein n=1 Tax=Flavobacterium sp. TaxID=239 RepID=UPI0028BF1288|nr:ABC transporter ATP-binding protein [Flavobacterium sp.]